MACKILLADDSVTAQNMGRKILADAGYEVVTVNNGSAALKKIVECKPVVAVLDVYMPGYSGLEVCARIKEGRDTAGIPVLLTVGKLEPFRQEEARKVHADAFIIKPFEATELLAALSKLESKAASKPELADEPKARESKASKHVAPTMDRYERMVADREPRFGDQESGWKARLTMPSAGSKHEEPAPEQEIASPPAPFREFDRDSDARPTFTVSSAPAAVESPNSLQGLPMDVTPDELAAIAAAAAAIGSATIERDFECLAPEPPAKSAESDTPSAAAATFAGEAVVNQPEAPQAVPASSSGPVSASVEAVLMSFAAAGPADAAVPVASELTPLAEPTAAAVIAGSDSASMAVGARWVAEEVPVEPAESGLILEREMHKAFAAFAAAEQRGAYEPGPVDKSDEPIFASIAPPAIGAPTPFVELTPTAARPKQFSEPVATFPAQEETLKTTQTPRTSEISKPPATPFPPVITEEPEHAVVAFGEPHPFGATEPAKTQGEEQPTELQVTPEPATSPETSAAVVSTPDNWHELRQSTAATPASGNGSKDTLEEYKSDDAGMNDVVPKLDSAMAAAAAADSSASSSAEASLSSIVDSMLAELKPKLMAELAKKLEKK